MTTATIPYIMGGGADGRQEQELQEVRDVIQNLHKKCEDHTMIRSYQKYKLMNVKYNG